MRRQEKVTKKKATPRFAAGFAGCPALLSEPGGCGTRASPSDSPRRLPPARLRCSALHEGREKHTDRNLERDLKPLAVDDRLVLPHALCVVEQRKTQRKKGEDCLRTEGPSSTAPVAAEQRREPGDSRATQWARLLLGYFFLARQEEVPRLQAKPGVSTR